MIKHAIKSQPNENDNPVTELIDKMRTLNKDQSLKDASNTDDETMKTEIHPTEAEPDQDWQSKIKDEFEERFTPYLKDQFLQLSDKQPEKNDFEMPPLSPTDSVDEKSIIEDGSADKNKPIESTEIHTLDSITENTLRSQGIRSGSSASDPPQRHRAINTLKKLKQLNQLSHDIEKGIQSIDFESIIESSSEAIDHLQIALKHLEWTRTA